MAPLRLLAPLGLVLTVATFVGCSSRRASSLDDLVRLKKSEFVDTSDGQPRVLFGDVHEGQQVRRDVVLDVSRLRDGARLTVKTLFDDSKLRIENGCETVPEKECVLGIEILNDGSGSTREQSTTLYIEDDDGRTTDIDLVYTFAGSPLRITGDGFDQAKGTLDVGTVYTPTTVTRTLTVENVSPQATAPLTVGVIQRLDRPAVLVPDTTDPDEGGVRIEKSSCGPGPLASGATCTVDITYDVRSGIDSESTRVGFATHGHVIDIIDLRGTSKRAAAFQVSGESFLELRQDFVGQGPYTGTVRVQNGGDQALRGVKLSLTGEDPGALTLDAQGCTEIAPASSCVVNVTGPTTMPATGLYALLSATADGARPWRMPIVGGEIMRVSVKRQTGSDVGGGTVTAAPAFLQCDDECIAVLRKSQVGITMTATPAKGYRFQRWSADECPGTGACVLRFEPGRRDVSAIFAPE